MIPLMKPLLLTAMGVGCLSLTESQEPVPPAAPPAPPALPGMPAAASAPFQGPAGFNGRIAVAGQGGSFYAPGENVVWSRTFGEDPAVKTMVKKMVEAKDDEVKEKLRAEVKTALSKAFDERLKGQQKQIEELEKQLDKLKAMVNKRKEAKAEIVADRLAYLEKDVKGLNW
jgi:hypothetical protein